MCERLSDLNEELTGRKASVESIQASAQGQLRAEPVGEVGNEDVGLDEVASSG